VARTVGIIQQRMGSSRLPGKAAMLIGDHSLTWHVINRVCQAKSLDDVVIAMPLEGELTAELIDTFDDLKVNRLIVGGDPCDLLYRYYFAANAYKADTVVRIPSDNPCIDPDEIDRIVEYYNAAKHPTGQWLYTNLDRNVLGNGYPGGLGAEVYSGWFIRWLDANVTDKRQREHPHVWAFDEGRVRTIPAPEAIRRPALRFDVNTHADLAYIRDIYAHIYPQKPTFRTADILAYLDSKEPTNGRERS